MIHIEDDALELRGRAAELLAESNLALAGAIMTALEGVPGGNLEESIVDDLLDQTVEATKKVIKAYQKGIQSGDKKIKLADITEEDSECRNKESEDVQEL